MIRKNHLISLLPLFALWGTAVAAEKIDLERVAPVPDSQPIPIQDFFRPPIFISPKINPAGTHIAARITSGADKYQLLAVEIATNKIETLGGAGEKDVYDFNWLDDKRLTFGVSVRKMYGVGQMAAEVGNFSRAYPLLQYYGASLVSVPRKNRTRPLFWARRDSSDGKDRGVVEVNTDLKTGSMVNLVAVGSTWSDFAEARDENERKITNHYPQPQGMVVGYLADKMGELAFAYTQADGVFTLHRFTGNSWEKTPIDMEKIDVVGAGNKPGELVVLSDREAGKPRALRFMDAASGEMGDVLLEDPGYDFTGWLYREPITRDIVGAVYERNGPHVVWFSEDYRILQKTLNGMFPGQVVRVIGSDDNSRIFLVATFSDKHPLSYHWVNLEKRSAGLVKNSMPWIDPKRMQTRNIIKFKTRDGYSLDAYLTLPAGATKANPPPLVVLPHGGPWARDTWGFDGEAQFLASRGYAVLQPNYRGSTGYGWMFPEEDDWAFRKMHDDVTDCVTFLLRSGHVDAKRVAICGGSFGGYLALSGVVNEPDLYRCAVTLAGVFDWAAMIKDSKYSQYDDPRYARLRRKLGDPAKEKEKFEAISPIRRVQQAKVPIFVSHGKDDAVVDVGESKRLINELERHGIPHEVLLVSEEGHGMGRIKNRVELYSRIESFLDKHLK